MGAESSVRQLSDAVNLVSCYCGPRDMPSLSHGVLFDTAGWQRADVLIYFGGGLLCGADELAQGIRNNVATTYMVVGGEGHTTEVLQAEASKALSLPLEHFRTKSEAEIVQEYLAQKFRPGADFLECESTNCGANITNALAILQEERIPHRRVILMQDAPMQRRIEAGWKFEDPYAEIVNYASYVARGEPKTERSSSLKHRRTSGQ